MPTYTIEVVTTGRKVFQVKDAESEEQARRIARTRHEQNAPIDLIDESCIVTDLHVVRDERDEGDDTRSMR